ncbi:flavodoxin domain-containing protein, partial [bacterium]
MIKRILIAFATWKGSTQEVALAISETLKEKKLEVDVKDVRKVKDVSLYDAVVIGTAVRMGRVHP